MFFHNVIGIFVPERKPVSGVHLNFGKALVLFLDHDTVVQNAFGSLETVLIRGGIS